jgi:hypothetical protein
MPLHELHQPASPRVPEHVHLFEAEAPPHGTDLGHKAIDAPARWVIRSVGLATAKLVVEDDWPIYCQGFERLQVVVSCARSPV